MVPTVKWIDIPFIYLDSEYAENLSGDDYEIVRKFLDNFNGFYGLDETSPNFDDIQEFFDRFEGYLIKVEDVFILYEKDSEQIEE